MSLPSRTVKAALVGACRVAAGVFARWGPSRSGHQGHTLAKGSCGTDESSFVGREDLIRRILSTVHCNSILLRGERGVGKTAVLRELARRLAEVDERSYEFHPIYVDLESVPERRLFAAVADAVLRELAPGLLGERDGERRAGADYGHRDLANDLRRVLSSLVGHCGAQIRIVLLIDGIDRLDSFHPRTAQRLRGLFMTSLSDSLVMVATAVKISRRWEREGSPWYNFFEQIALEALSPEDAKRMIEVSVKGVMEVEAEAVERILALTDRHPLRIRTYCGRLFERLREQGRSTVTLADVELIGSSEAG